MGQLQLMRDPCMCLLAGLGPDLVIHQRMCHSIGQGSVLPLLWRLSLLLYINPNAFCILLGSLCLSYQYNQHILLVFPIGCLFGVTSRLGSLTLFVYYMA
jgi:hypothetical protein